MSASKSSATKDDGKVFKFLSAVTERLAKGKEGEFIQRIQDAFMVRIGKESAQHCYRVKGSPVHVEGVIGLLERLDREAQFLAVDQKLAAKGEVKDAHWHALSFKLTSLISQTKEQVDDELRLRRTAITAAADAEKRLLARLAPLLKKPLPRKPTNGNGNGKNNDKAAKAGPAHFLQLDPETFEPRNATQAMFFLAMQDPAVSLVFATGPAGGGKSYPALRAGFEAYNRGEVEHVLLIRPRTVSARGDFGAVRGDAQSKMRPYLDGQSGNIHDLTGVDADDLIKKGVLLAGTPDFDRGKTFKHSFVLVDEPQNLSRQEAELLITRIGEGTRMVFAGDIGGNQNDLHGEIPGLVHLIATQGPAALHDEVLREGSAFLRYTVDDSSARHGLLPSINRALSEPAADGKYEKILNDVRMARRDFRLVSAIGEAKTYASEIMDKMHAQTTERYAAEATRRWPALFAGNANIIRLSTPPRQERRQDGKGSVPAPRQA